MLLNVHARVQLGVNKILAIMHIVINPSNNSNEITNIIDRIKLYLYTVGIHYLGTR